MIGHCIQATLLQIGMKNNVGQGFLLKFIVLLSLLVKSELVVAIPGALWSIGGHLNSHVLGKC